jgi:hypothetical protein
MQQCSKTHQQLTKEAAQGLFFEQSSLSFSSLTFCMGSGKSAEIKIFTLLVLNLIN